MCISFCPLWLHSAICSIIFSGKYQGNPSCPVSFIHSHISHSKVPLSTTAGNLPTFFSMWLFRLQSLLLSNFIHKQLSPIFKITKVNRKSSLRIVQDTYDYFTTYTIKSTIKSHRDYKYNRINIFFYNFSL